MNNRKFPNLIVICLTGVDSWPGMIPLETFDFRALCDDDLVPGLRTSTLLRSEAYDCLAEAKVIAQAIFGFDGTIRSGPFLSVLPHLMGNSAEMVIAWVGARGSSFVATTVPLPQLDQISNRYAGYNENGRIMEIEPAIP